MKNKFNAKKTEYRGVIYDSKKEASYALRLNSLKMAGFISYYERQHVFVLPWGSKMKIDFKVVFPCGRKEYHKVKGGKTTMTLVYRLKKKVVEWYFGVKIKEV